MLFAAFCQYPIKMIIIIKTELLTKAVRTVDSCKVAGTKEMIVPTDTRHAAVSVDLADSVDVTHNERCGCCLHGMPYIHRRRQFNLKHSVLKPLMGVAEKRPPLHGILGDGQLAGGSGGVL